MVTAHTLHSFICPLFAPFSAPALSKLVFYRVSRVKLLFIPPLGTFTGQEFVTVWWSLLAPESPNWRCLCHPRATGAFTGHSTHDDLVTKADYSTNGVFICLQYGIDSHYRYRPFQIRPAWPNTWYQCSPLTYSYTHLINTRMYLHVFHIPAPSRAALGAEMIRSILCWQVGGSAQHSVQ